MGSQDPLTNPGEEQNSIDKMCTGSSVSARDKSWSWQLRKKLDVFRCLHLSHPYSHPRLLQHFGCHFPAKEARRTQDQASPHLGFTLGCAGDLLFDLFRHPVETNSTFVRLYFCSYSLQVLRAELSLDAEGVMHNNFPVLVRTSTSSNAKMK